MTILWDHIITPHPIISDKNMNQASQCSAIHCAIKTLDTENSIDFQWFLVVKNYLITLLLLIVKVSALTICAKCHFKIINEYAITNTSKQSVNHYSINKTWKKKITASVWVGVTANKLNSPKCLNCTSLTFSIPQMNIAYTIAIVNYLRKAICVSLHI